MIVKQDVYEKWLHRRAIAHVKRDKKHPNSKATISAYKEKIHRAVNESNGRDFYTGENLDWQLLSQWSNDKSRDDGREYKAGFALLPSVDHADGRRGEIEFRICAWRTNDAKNDLTHQEFVELCRRVIEHAPSMLKSTS